MIKSGEQAKAEFWKQLDMGRQPFQAEEDIRKMQLLDIGEELPQQQTIQESTQHWRQSESKGHEYYDEDVMPETEETYNWGQKYLLELEQKYQEEFQEEMRRKTEKEKSSVKFFTETTAAVNPLENAMTMDDQDIDVQKKQISEHNRCTPLGNAGILLLDVSKHQVNEGSFSQVLDREIADMDRRLTLLGMLHSTPRTQMKDTYSAFQQKESTDRSARRMYNASESQIGFVGKGNCVEDTKSKVLFPQEWNRRRSVTSDNEVDNMPNWSSCGVKVDDNQDYQMAYYYQGYKRALEEVKRFMPDNISPRVQNETEYMTRNRGDTEKSDGERQYRREEHCESDINDDLYMAARSKIDSKRDVFERDLRKKQLQKKEEDLRKLEAELLKKEEWLRNEAINREKTGVQRDITSSVNGRTFSVVNDSDLD